MRDLVEFMRTERLISLPKIIEASNTIERFVTRTPTYLSRTLSARRCAEVYLKLECFQPVGTFKIRGAINKVCHLSPPQIKLGFVTSSSGNHGLSTAYAAMIFGTKATVVVPRNATREKVEAIQSYGARVVRHGKDYDEAYTKALEIRKRTGATFIHPFNDPFVIAGQGTIGLELLLDIPDLRTIIVPIGGGGLISGISVAAKSLNPHIKIVGVQPEGAPAIYLSWKAGKTVEVDSLNTVADGLATRKPAKLTFRIIQKYVDSILLVTEREINEAVMTLLRSDRILAEPSGAASLAALLFKYSPRSLEKVAVIITGRNISTDYLATLLRSGTRHRN